MSEDRKVYIPNKCNLDFSGAEKFGTPVFVTYGHLRLSKGSIKWMSKKVEGALKDAAPGDFILVSSLNSLCSILAATYAHRFGELNLLVHHKGTYTPYYIKLTQEAA